MNNNSEVSYWNNKLEKIQLALDYLRRVKEGQSIDKLIENLEKMEKLATEDLIQAETAEAKNG